MKAITFFKIIIILFNFFRIMGIPIESEDTYSLNSCISKMLPKEKTAIVVLPNNHLDLNYFRHNSFFVYHLESEESVPNFHINSTIIDYVIIDNAQLGPNFQLIMERLQEAKTINMHTRVILIQNRTQNILLPIWRKINCNKNFKVIVLKQTAIICTKTKKCPINMASLQEWRFSQIFESLNLSLSIGSGDDQYTDLENQLIGTLAKWLNFKVELVEVKDSDWNSSDLMEYLFQNESKDILGGNLHPDAELYQKYDYSSIFQQSSYHWCVPYLLRYKHLQNIFAIITPIALMCTLLLYAILAVFYHKTSDNKSKIDSCLNTFSILLGIAVKNHPTRSQHRYFFIILTIFGFWIIVMIQSALSSKLALTDVEQIYQNAQDLLSDDVDVYCYPNLESIFKNDNSTFGQLYKTKLEFIYSVENILIDFLVTHETSAAFCNTLENAYLNIKAMLKSEGNIPSWYCFKEAISMEFVNFYMRKGFPFTEQFNDGINRILASGLIQKWRPGPADTPKMIDNLYGKRGPRKLHMKLLKPVFWIWLGGCGIGFVIFLMELFVHHTKKRFLC